MPVNSLVFFLHPGVWLPWAALAAQLGIALISIINTLTFPRLKPGAQVDTPRVSILVPARNEAAVISSTLRSLLNQQYADFEVILLDDASTDETTLRALETAAGDSRFHLAVGQPLPEGWGGKNWACHQLAGLAQGDILVFTDADVHWQPAALPALVAAMQHHSASVFTVWPTQETISLSERLVVPLIMLVVLGYLPEICVRYLPFKIFAAANGQCLAFQRQAYARTGGHAAVRAEIVEDVALARRAKAARQKLVMCLGNRLISTRMYQDWKSVRLGFAKNILAGHSSSPLLLLTSAFFHWTLFVFPWLWLALGWLLPPDPRWPAFPAALAALALGTRLLSAAASNLRLSDALWMPFSVFLMTIIAAQSTWWRYRYGGPLWKDRWLPARFISARREAHPAEPALSDRPGEGLLDGRQ